MALRGTLTHRKTRRLAQALDIPPCYALGVVEALWHVTAEQTPDGAIGKLTNEDIADEMFYDGDPDALIDALVATRWLDRCAVHRLVVHGWTDHADQATRRKLARQNKKMAVADPEKPPVTSHDSSRLAMTSLPVSSIQYPESREEEREAPTGASDLDDTAPEPTAPDPEPAPEPIAEPARDLDDILPECSQPAPTPSPPLSPPKPKRPKSAPRLRFRPTDEILTQERIDIALGFGLSPDEAREEWDAMGDHEYRDPKSDWTKTWRTWCRRSVLYRQRAPTGRNGSTHVPPRVAALGASLDRARPPGAPPLPFGQRAAPPPPPPLRLAGGTST